MDADFCILLRTRQMTLDLQNSSARVFQEGVQRPYRGLDGSVLPGLIDGESRNLGKYDDALKAPLPTPVSSMLFAQRSTISQKIALMESQEAAYKAEAS